MRRMKCPLLWRAASQANSAVRTEPKCRAPVGEGAKRVRTGPAEPLTSTASVRRCEEDERENGPRQQPDDEQRAVDVGHGDTHHPRCDVDLLLLAPQARVVEDAADQEHTQTRR